MHQRYSIRVMSDGKWHSGSDCLPDVPCGSVNLVELTLGEYTQVQIGTGSIMIWSSDAPSFGLDMRTLQWEEVELILEIRQKYFGGQNER